MNLFRRLIFISILSLGLNGCAALVHRAFPDDGHYPDQATVGAVWAVHPKWGQAFKHTLEHTLVPSQMSSSHVSRNHVSRNHGTPYGFSQTVYDQLFDTRKTWTLMVSPQGVGALSDVDVAPYVPFEGTLNIKTFDVAEMESFPVCLEVQPGTRLDHTRTSYLTPWVQAFWNGRRVQEVIHTLNGTIWVVEQPALDRCGPAERHPVWTSNLH